MGAKDHKKHALKNIGFAIVTVSDTRTQADDFSGALIKKLVVKAGHRVIAYELLKNDKNMIIRAASKLLVRDGVDAVVFCGGTGISSKDITVESIRPMFDKELSGFGEIFRSISYKEIGSAAIMSRAIAGVVEGKIVFCIPGSKNAAKLVMEKLILAECGHILWEAGR